MAGTLHIYDQDGTEITNISMTGVLAQPRGIVYMGQRQFIACSNANWSWFHISDDMTSLHETKQVNGINAQISNSNQVMHGMCTDGHFIYVAFSNPIPIGGGMTAPNGGVAQFTNEGTLVREAWGNNGTWVDGVAYDGVFFHTVDPSVPQSLVRQWHFFEETTPQLIALTRKGGLTDILDAIEYNGKDYLLIDSNSPEDFFVADRSITKIGGTTGTVTNIEDITYAPAEDFIQSTHSHWVSGSNQRYVVAVERS